MALSWTRQFLLYEGAFPDPALVGQFTRLFSNREQTDILAVVKMMSFFNLLSNTVFSGPQHEDIGNSNINQVQIKNHNQE